MDTQREFFFQKSCTFGLEQTFWEEKFWSIWDIFGRTMSTYFETVMSSIIQSIFYKKVSLYIQLPNIYFGVGFEFGPQKI